MESLGISAHLDITEVQDGFSQLIKELEELGEISIFAAQKMEGALAQLGDSLANGSITEGVQSLTSLMEQTAAQLETTLKAIADGKINISYDELYSLISNYQSLATAAAEAAQQAFDSEQQHVADLTAKIAELTEEMEELEFMGDAKGAQALSNEIQKLSGEAQTSKDNISEMSSKLDELKESANHADEALESVASKEQTARVAEMKDAFVDLGGALKEWVSVDRFTASLTGLKDAAALLHPAIGRTIKSIQLMTKAMWAVVSHPIGWVLAALALALKAVWTWFHKSAEGQKVFARLSAATGVILEQLMQIVIELGDYLYHAFADANGPLHDYAYNLIHMFGSAIKGVYNLVKGLAEAISGMWDIVTSRGQNADIIKGWAKIQQARQDFKDYGNAVIDTWDHAIAAGKGAVKAWSSVASDINKNFSFDSLGKWWGNLEHAINSSMDIASENLLLENQLLDVKEGQAALQEQIAASQERIASLTGEEKQKEIANLRTLEERKYNEEIAIREKQLENMRKRRKLTGRETLEDLDNEQKAQIAINTLYAQKAGAMRTNARLQAQATKESERAQKAEEKAAAAAERRAAAAAKRELNQSNAQTKAENKLKETIAQNAYEQAKAAQETEQKIEEARIAAMKEGAEKVRAQREFENKKELDDIIAQRDEAVKAERDRQKKEWEDTQALIKQRGGKIRPMEESDFDQTEIQAINDQYERLSKWVVERQALDELNAATENYKSYYDQRIDIERKYNEDIAELERQREIAWENNDKETEALLTRSIAKAERDRGLALMKNNLEELKNSRDYVRAFENLDYASSETLDALIQRFEEAKVAAGGALNPQDLKEYTDAIAKMREELMSRDPFSMLSESLTEVAAAEKEVAIAQQRIDDIKNGIPAFKTYIDENGKLVVVAWSLAAAEQELKDRQNNLNKAQADYVKNVNAACKQVDALANKLTSVGKAIGGTAGEIMSFIGDIITFATSAINTISTTATNVAAATSKTMKAIEKASAILTILAAAISLISKLQSILPTTDALYEKAARKQAQINKLTEAVNDYKLAVLESQQAERNWFADNGLTSLTDSYERHGRVVEAYYNELLKAQEKYQNKSSGLSKVALPIALAAAAVVAGALTFGLGAIGVGALGAGLVGAASSFGAGLAGAAIAGAAGAITGQAIQSGIDNITYNGNQTAAWENLRMQTRHKSFWRGEKTQDLRDWVRENLDAELFDEQGLVNLEAARTVLEQYGDKLVGETKETLEKLVELREKYDEFMENVRDYISDLYSPLVDNMTDALYDWLETGTDVLNKFRQNANETFANVAKDMVRQMLMKRLFDDLSKDLENVYANFAITGNTTELADNIVAASETFMDKAEKELPSIQKALQVIDKRFEDMGYDITASKQRNESGTYKAVSSFSQDQGDELNGRLTAIQLAQYTGNNQRALILETQHLMLGSVMQLDAKFTSVADNISEMREIQFDSLRRLTEIRDFTSVLPTMSNNIQDMRNDIRNKL